MRAHEQQGREAGEEGADESDEGLADWLTVIAIDSTCENWSGDFS